MPKKCQTAERKVQIKILNSTFWHSKMPVRNHSDAPDNPRVKKKQREETAGECKLNGWDPLSTGMIHSHIGQTLWGEKPSVGDNKPESSPAGVARFCSAASAATLRSCRVCSDMWLCTDDRLRFSKLSAPSRPWRNAFTTRIYDAPTEQNTTHARQQPARKSNQTKRNRTKSSTLPNTRHNINTTTTSTT